MAAGNRPAEAETAPAAPAPQPPDPALTARSRALEEAARSVQTRLDTAIERLSAILEN